MNTIDMATTNSTIQIARLQKQNAHLLEQLDTLYRGFAHEEGHTAPPEHFTEFVRAHLDDASMLVALALAESDASSRCAVGYALVFDVASHPFIPNWDRCGYITQMFVDEAHRRRGIGQQMLAFSLDWLRQRGVPDVMLNVDVDNEEGEQFWRTTGFRPYLTRMKKSLTP